jgi:universal stress protein A
MKVLVPVDSSDCCQGAIEHIARQSWWGDTKFLILHVMAIETANDFPEYGFCTDAKYAEERLLAAQELVGEKTAYLVKMLGAKMHFECEVVQGYPADVIKQTAIDWNADLIIMASHGYRGLKKFFLGSVAENVLSGAPCSVEIIKTPAAVAADGDSKEKEKETISAASDQSNKTASHR